MHQDVSVSAPSISAYCQRGAVLGCSKMNCTSYYYYCCVRVGQS